ASFSRGTQVVPSAWPRAILWRGSGSLCEAIPSSDEAPGALPTEGRPIKSVPIPRNEIVTTGAVCDGVFPEPRDGESVPNAGSRLPGLISGRVDGAGRSVRIVEGDDSESRSDLGKREGNWIAEPGNSISRNDRPGPWPTPLARNKSSRTSAARKS